MAGGTGGESDRPERVAVRKGGGVKTRYQKTRSKIGLMKKEERLKRREEPKKRSEGRKVQKDRSTLVDASGKVLKGMEMSFPRVGKAGR